MQNLLLVTFAANVTRYWVVFHLILIPIARLCAPHIVADLLELEGGEGHRVSFSRAETDAGRSGGFGTALADTDSSTRRLKACNSS